MPTIPFIEETVKTGNAAAPVLDNVRRPNVSADETVNALGRLGQASQSALVDADPLTAQDRALSRAGAVIAETGGMLQAAAAKRKEAKDYTDTALAKARLKDSLTEFETWKLNNPDPSKWAEGWQKHVAGVSKQVLENPGMSTEARREMESTVGMFSNSGRIDVEHAATVQQFANAKASAKHQADQAFEAGDVKAGEAILTDATKRGWLDEYEAGQYIKGGKKVVEKRLEQQAFDANYGSILQDPDAWLEANKGNKAKLDVSMFDNLQSQAYQQKKLNQSAIAADFADAMVTDGAIKGEDDIRQRLSGQRPAVVADAINDWKQLQQEEVKAYNSSLPGLMANTGRLIAEIDRFDPKAKDAEGQRLRTEYMIKALVPEGYRAGLIKKLDEKWNPPKTPQNPTLNSWGTDQIKAWFDDRKFGEFDIKPQANDPRYKKPLVIDRPGWFTGDDILQQKQPTIGTDTGARDKAMIARAEVEMQWADWQKKNPTATIEDGKKALGAIVADRLLPSDVDTLMRSPLPPPPPGRTAADVLRGFSGTGAAPPLYMAEENPEGLISAGNINLANRPRVKNADGSVSTVKSMSIGTDAGEVLIPMVSDDGRVMGEEEAITTYRKTGRNLGVFATPEAATKYAEKLHQQQAQTLGGLDEDLVSTVKALEGFNAEAFGDYKQTSVGYGTRAKAAGEKITKEEGDRRLREELGMHARNIDEAAAKSGVVLTPKRRNALISFDFNTGSGAHLLETSGGDWSEIKRRMALYTKAGGDELPGLKRRREKELAMMD